MGEGGSCKAEPATSTTTTTTPCHETEDPRDCNGGLCCPATQVRLSRCDGLTWDHKPGPTCCPPGLACKLKLNPPTNITYCVESWADMTLIDPYGVKPPIKQEGGTCKAEL